MKNIFRFFIGLGIAIVAILFLVIVGLLLSPLIIGGGILFLILLSIAIFLFVLLWIFGFIWYLSREEPRLGKSKNFSIKQGKDAV